jgi:mono/diheme cytochrome c family protein
VCDRRILVVAVATVGLGVGTLWWLGWAKPTGGKSDANTGRLQSAFQRENVEWLLANRLSCLGCHTIEGRGGGLGPDLTDVASRLNAEAIDKQVVDPQARNPESIMPPVAMPTSWRRALVSYLAKDRDADALSETERKPRSEASEEGIQAAAALYRRLCSGCHGETGKGDGPNASNLPIAPARHADAALMARRTDDWLFDIIARGGYPMGRHPFMPPYGDLLTPRQIRDMVAHLRQLCECEGLRWSRDGRGGAGRP